MSDTNRQARSFLEAYPTLEYLLSQNKGLSPWHLKWTEPDNAASYDLGRRAAEIPIMNWLYLREQLLAQGPASPFNFLNQLSSLLSLAQQNQPFAEAQAQLAEVEKAALEVIRLMNLGLEADDRWNRDGKMEGVIKLMEKLIGDKAPKADDNRMVYTYWVNLEGDIEPEPHMRLGNASIQRYSELKEPDGLLIAGQPQAIRGVGDTLQDAYEQAVKNRQAWHQLAIDVIHQNLTAGKNQ